MKSSRIFKLHKQGGCILTLQSFFIICSCIISLLILGCSDKSTTTTNMIQSENPATPFVIAGSGTNIPVTAKLAESYYAKTGIKIDVPGSIGSDGAINAVSSGNLELGLISKQLTPIQRAAGLKELPYARVAIIFGAHINVPDSNLWDSDIILIIKGLKTTWSDGRKIHVFVRQNNDSSNLALYCIVPGYQESLLNAYENQRWQVIYSDSDMSEALKENNGAFGLTASTEISKKGSKTKPLHYNGIPPTIENIRNGTYPLTEDLSFIYKDPLSSRATNFLNYVFSDEGQNVLNKWGSSPIGR